MAEYILELKNITKKFPGVLALDDISFYLNEGEVCALVGENGAGKSTLVKILMGFYKPDNGTIFMNSKKIKIMDPKHAMDLGISTVYQETSLVQEITVAENIFLGRQPIGKFGTIDWGTMYERAKNILDRLSIDLLPNTIVSNLSAAQQQLVEIAKAFSINAKIIILDEPTAAISKKDTENLFRIIKSIIKDKVSIIYISHRLKEIFEIASRVVVLRDGRLIANLNIKDTNEKSIVKYMVGRNIDNKNEEYKEPEDEILLEVKNLNRKGKFHDISFNLRKGEILGFSGLVGAGRSEVVRAIFGLDRIDNGDIYIKSHKREIKSTSDAIKQGITFVSEDRRLESIIQNLSVKVNLTVLILESLANRIGLMNKNKESEIAKQYIQRFSIKTPSLDQIVMNLSGGNQQRIALAKCISAKPEILILDEPTKGIDVGAKREIYKIINNLARDGIGIIIVSSELTEIISLCHRVVVMHEGALINIFRKEELTEENLMFAAMGNLPNKERLV